MEVEYEHNGDGRALVKAEFIDYHRHGNGSWALQIRINGESFTFTQDHLRGKRSGRIGEGCGQRGRAASLHMR